MFGAKKKPEPEVKAPTLDETSSAVYLVRDKVDRRTVQGAGIQGQRMHKTTQRNQAANENPEGDGLQE